MNEDICDKVGVASLLDQTREEKVTWFGHAMRRSAEALVRRYERLDIVDTNRRKDKPKRYWRNMIKQDMTQLLLIKDMT